MQDSPLNENPVVAPEHWIAGLESEAFNKVLLAITEQSSPVPCALKTQLLLAVFPTFESLIKILQSAADILNISEFPAVSF